MSSVISERTFSNRRRPPHSMMNHRSSGGGGGSSNRSVIGGGVDSRHFLLPHNQQQHFNGFHPNEVSETQQKGDWVSLGRSFGQQGISQFGKAICHLKALNIL